MMQSALPVENAGLLVLLRRQESISRVMEYV